MENLKGRRFKVTYLTERHEAKGIEIGDEGVVLDNGVVPWVRMDKCNILLGDAVGLCQDGHGTYMSLDQIELLPEEWTPKFGEEVLVWNKDGKFKAERIFLFKREDSEFPYNVVVDYCEDSFDSRCEAYEVELFKQIAPLPETITKAEAEAQLGKKIID